MSLILKAARYAANAHRGQTRKDGKTPYIRHPERVAARRATRPDSTEIAVAASFLHDVVEDTDLTVLDLTDKFGYDVARLVGELTNPSSAPQFKDLPRAERKCMDRDHLAEVSHEAKLIKLLDRIDNLNDNMDPEDIFSPTYAIESLLLVDALRGTDKPLEAELTGLAEDLRKRCDECRKS